MTAFDPKYALVRILEDNTAPKRPLGAGFMVSDRMAMTCAHVVDGRERVFLDFPLLDGAVYRASVDKVIHPVEWPVPDLPEDIALLLFSDDIPFSGGVTPVIGEMLSDAACFTSSAWVMGFPKNMDSGDWLDVQLKGKNAAGRIQLDHDTGSRFIARGFSGTPAWNKNITRVLGMVVGRADRDGAPAGYVIPVSTLARVFPRLSQVSGPPVDLAAEARRCDRADQVAQFQRFYHHCREIDRKEDRCRPQFYFLCGLEGEGHLSLIDRFQKEYIKEKNGDPPLYKPIENWPETGDLKWRMDVLGSIIAASVRQTCGPPPECAVDICRFPCFDMYDKVVLVHNIYTKHWNNGTATLIAEYMSGFWKDCDQLEKEFIIFLNIIHDREPAGWFRRMFKGRGTTRESIEMRIEEIVQKTARSCPYLHVNLIQPLSPVKMSDVLDWRNVRWEIRKEALAEIEKMFKKNTPVTMEKIEGMLLEILNTHYCLRNQ